MSTQTPTSEVQQRAKIHTELGSLYLLDGRPAVAQEESRIALGIDPGYAPAFNLLGLTHMTLNESKQAEENFERALRIAPGDPEFNNNYGWFLCLNGREKQSMSYFMTAANNPLYTTPTKPYTNAGICSIRLKDDKTAQEYLQQAVRLAASNTQALYWLADIAYRQARFSDARQIIAEIEKLIEPTVEVLWLAIRVERKLGSRETEARLGSQLRRRFPGTSEYQQLQQGQFE
jgi:type IV pilus assembly protein PilF